MSGIPIQASVDSFALAGYLMVQRLMVRLALESERMKQVCAKVLEESAADAESEDGLGLEAAALIRRVLEMVPFSSPGRSQS